MRNLHLSSAMSHVDSTDDFSSLSCSVGLDRVPASTSSEELVGAVALVDSSESAGVTSLACSSEQVRDPSPAPSEGLVKNTLKNKMINIFIIPGNKGQLPGDALGATPEASNNKMSPQCSSPALNSNFYKIRNNNL